MSWQVREVARRAGIDHRPDPADAVRLADEGQPAAHRMRRSPGGPRRRRSRWTVPGRARSPGTGPISRSRTGGSSAATVSRGRTWLHGGGRGGGGWRARTGTGFGRRGGGERIHDGEHEWHGPHGGTPGNAAHSWRTAGQSQLWRSGEAGVAARGVRRGSRTLRRWLAGVATSRGGASSRCGAGWNAAASRIHCPTTRAVMHYSRRHERHAPAADTGAHVRYTCPS